MVDSPPADPNEPQKPNLLRPLAVILTILAAIGTGATIVGGGILISYHLLTVDDYNTRRAAGITTVVIGALLIPPGAIVGLLDAWQMYRWWSWKRNRKQAVQSIEAMQRQPPATIVTVTDADTQQQHVDDQVV